MWISQDNDCFWHNKNLVSLRPFIGQSPCGISVRDVIDVDILDKISGGALGRQTIEHGRETTEHIKKSTERSNCGLVTASFIKSKGT